jgi:hypothetical protein
MSADRFNTPPPGVDGVEIKATFGAGQVDKGLAAFGLDRDAAERRRIWFGESPRGRGDDPPALPLLARGIILRVRKRADHADDATLKLRGPEGCIDPQLWRDRTGAFGEQARIEGDWMGARHLLSASLDGEVEGGRIDEVVAERPHRVRRLLSGPQEALAAEWLLPLGEVELLGPVDAWKWELRVEGFEDEVAAELWEVKDGLRFLELSILVHQDPTGKQQQLEELVRGRDLVIDEERETKTRKVLEHFAKVHAP